MKGRGGLDGGGKSSLTVACVGGLPFVLWQEPLRNISLSDSNDTGEARGGRRPALVLRKQAF